MNIVGSLATIALSAIVGLGCCSCSEMHFISEPVESQTLSIAPGDQWHIKLEENATTGFMWQSFCEDATVKHEIEHLPPERKESGFLCGAPGSAYVSISVGDDFAGPSEVRLKYMRSWSGETAREIVFSLKQRTE